MKVKIFTQPLGHNYGGLLQAYALQSYLANLGCEVETIDRRAPMQPFTKTIKEQLKNVLRLLLGRIKSLPTRSRQEYVLAHLREFNNRYIASSPRLSSNSELIDYFKSNQCDLIVVGSDQVWRPRYSPCIENFFLDFYEKIDSNAKRISYAASFGVDEWEFTAEQTKVCSALAKRFDAVTVREHSAVDLCKQYFGIQVQCVVDPTLLLEPSEYVQLMPHDDVFGMKGKVLCYVLDPSADKQAIAVEVASKLAAEAFSIKPTNNYTEVKPSAINSCQYPSVECWLQSFYLADFVVTDSFHGCVFSILFNKPFVAVGNSARGLTRFASLLSMFGLKDRLVQSVGEVTEALIKAPIDWGAVNQKRITHANTSQAFLKKYVSEAA